MKKKPMSVALALAVTAGCSAQSGGDLVGHSSEAISVSSVYNFGTLAKPGSCMDAQGAGTGDGTQIQEWACDGSVAQAYELQDAGNGAFALFNANAGKCVDVQARGTANGTKIQLYDCNGTGAQQWQAQADGSLLNPSSGRCLDDPSASTANSTQLQIWDCNGQPQQHWQLPA